MDKLKQNKTENAGNGHSLHPMLATGFCTHYKWHIAEREFYPHQKNSISGTLAICKKCGKTKFIKDIFYGKYIPD